MSARDLKGMTNHRQRRWGEEKVKLTYRDEDKAAWKASRDMGPKKETSTESEK